MGTSNGVVPELSKFGKDTTAMEVVASCDLRGKFAVIIGANRGIGFETARALASRGCTVIFACRNLDKAKSAVKLMKKKLFSAQCDILHLDLCSLDSVRQFVEDYMSKYEAQPLHYLVLNAATYPAHHELSNDGYEVAYQTQHLSYFFLVRLMADKLATSAPSRIVVLSCSAIEVANEQVFSLESFQENFFTGSKPVGKEWDAEVMYGNSKVLNVLFALQLSRQFSDKKVSVFIAQPHKTRTNMYNKDMLKHLITQISLFDAQSAEQAAATSTMCCVTPGLERYSGSCFADCHLIDIPKWMLNVDLQQRLWSISEQAVAHTLSGAKTATKPSSNSTSPSKKSSRLEKEKSHGDLAATSKSEARRRSELSVPDSHLSGSNSDLTASKSSKR